jgi:MFS family permease
MPQGAGGSTSGAAIGDQRPWRLGAADRVLVAAVLLALFMAALEQTVVAPALPEIGRSLGNPELLPWVATGYLLAATALGPIFGALADTVGRRPALLAALGLFVAGSIGAALAPGMAFLVAARVLQGAGAGGLVALPFVVVADKVPMTRRAGYSAFISTLYAIAGLGGPPLGGALTQYAHWSQNFRINLPLGAAVACVLVAQRLPKRQRPSRPVDLVGALLLLIASAASILTLELAAGGGGQQEHARIAAMAAVAAWAGFGWRLRAAESPLIPIGILTEPTILLCTLGLLCAQGANLGLSLYLPFYYQRELGLDTVQSGMALMALVGGVAVGAYVPARLLARDPRYKRPTVVAGIVALAGACAVMLALAAPPSLPRMLAATILMGLGIGGLYPIFTIATQSAAGRERIGGATGLLTFSRSMGGSIGVAGTGMIAGAIGLTGVAVSGTAAPVWLLGSVPAGLLLVCAIAMALLPSRRLQDL